MCLTITLGVSCEYQPIYERDTPYEVARIPVKINWAHSGFEVDSKGFSKQSSTTIHRVSLRFFPKNGDPCFERYIGDGHSLIDGMIDVPIGEYSVIVMNESISDTYWEGTQSGGAQSLFFENTDNYLNFAAYVKTQSSSPAGYYWDESYDNNLFINSPLRLATWSLDDFEVTEEMVNYTQSKSDPEDVLSSLSKSEADMYLALTRDYEGDEDGIDMRKLTYDIEIKLQVKNLTSVAEVKGGMLGFTNKVNMRTAIAYREPDNKTMIQYFTFNGRQNWYNPQGQYMGDGWQPVSGENTYEDYTGQTSVKFLSLGRDIPLEENSGHARSGLYFLDLDFLYISGELMDTKNREFLVDLDDDPSTPYVETKLPFDLTYQTTKINSSISSAIDIDINVNTIDVDYTSGDITVEEWESGGVIPLGVSANTKK